MSGFADHRVPGGAEVKAKVILPEGSGLPQIERPKEIPEGYVGPALYQVTISGLDVTIRQWPPPKNLFSRRESPRGSVERELAKDSSIRELRGKIHDLFLAKAEQILDSSFMTLDGPREREFFYRIGRVVNRTPQSLKRTTEKLGIAHDEMLDLAFIHREFGTPMNLLTKIVGWPECKSDPNLSRVEAVAEIVTARQMMIEESFPNTHNGRRSLFNNWQGGATSFNQIKGLLSFGDVPLDADAIHDVSRRLHHTFESGTLWMSVKAALTFAEEYGCTTVEELTVIAGQGFDLNGFNCDFDDLQGQNSDEIGAVDPLVESDWPPRIVDLNGPLLPKRFLKDGES